MGFDTIHGFEITRAVSNKTKRLLKSLADNGVLIFEHDDGADFSIRMELENVAGDIGLYEIRERYRLIIFSEDGEKKFLKR